MRQTIATKSKILFMYFYGLLLLAMPIRWSSASSGSPSWVHVVCHILCSSCSLLSWQLLVSFIPPCSLLPSFPSISFHSQALLLLSLHGVYSNRPGYTQKHTYSFAIPRFISLHFRSTAAFIHFSRVNGIRKQFFFCLMELRLYTYTGGYLRN